MICSYRQREQKINLYLDFNLIKCLAIVHTNNGPNHFWNNDHVTKMCLDHLKQVVGKMSEHLHFDLFVHGHISKQEQINVTYDNV